MIFLLLVVLLPHIGLSAHNLVAGHANFEESLTPYSGKHGSGLSHRSIRECHQNELGSVPHEVHPAHTSVNISVPFVKVKQFVKEVPSSLVFSSQSRTIRGHYVIVSNPLQTLSVLEPEQIGGCNLNIRQTVADTAKKNNCFVAINAGYFDTKKGTCYGNVISDGRRAHDNMGVQNAHFGLTEDGKIFTGYLSREQFLSENFNQLVGGVVWILRNGTGFVNTSKRLECEDTEETGSMDQFVRILSARTVMGHDEDGNVIFVQVDGKSGKDGINLFEMENLLKEFGVISAINLDGGGSSTLVINGTIVNYPYDVCPEEQFSCDRKVSTILCVHPPYCNPNNCNGHGICIMGECKCENNWLPPSCDQIFCGQHNCSNHGLCLPQGCACHPGYFGEECEKSCPGGWFGGMCTEHCDCLNAQGCDPVTGSCLCKPGFIGQRCEHQCPDGFFGLNCQSRCQCENSCYCDPIVGSCDISRNSSLYHAAKCLAKTFIQEQHLVQDNSEERKKWYMTIVILGVITALCITSFLLIICCSCSCYCRNEQLLCSKPGKKSYKKYQLQLPSGELSDSSSDSESHPMKVLQKS